MTQAVTPGQKIVIPSAQFYDCLDEWFLTDSGRNEKKNINFDDNGEIESWRQYIDPIEIKTNIFIDGPQYLQDMNLLAKRHGIPDTFTQSEDMLLYEQFVVLINETVT